MKKLISMVSALLLCLFLSTCAYAVKPPPPDYLGMMSRAAARGDVTAGREAEALRAALIDETGSNEPKVSFDELYLLSRFINCEAGSIWVSDELRMCVGEVVLNRVASPEYPDSIEEVIYQEGQYEKVGTEEFQNLTQPALVCVDAAMRLLLGERMLEPQVVLQSKGRTGTVYAIFCDRRLGYTYFCESPYPELYALSASESAAS